MTESMDPNEAFTMQRWMHAAEAEGLVIKAYHPDDLNEFDQPIIVNTTQIDFDNRLKALGFELVDETFL